MPLSEFEGPPEFVRKLASSMRSTLVGRNYSSALAETPGRSFVTIGNKNGGIRAAGPLPELSRGAYWFREGYEA